MADIKNSGYDTSWFVSEDSIKEYICSICMLVARNASTTECDHIYCTPCITEWFAKKKECPFCRKEDPAITKNTFVDKRILDLKVHPENRKRKHASELKEQTLKERLQQTKTWCILCCEEVYPDEHVMCPSRNDSEEGKKLMEGVVSNRIKFRITCDQVFDASNVLATDFITVNDLKSPSFKPRKTSDKWGSISSDIHNSGKANATIITHFQPDQLVLTIANLHHVRTCFAYRVFLPGRTVDIVDTGYTFGELSRDKIVSRTRKFQNVNINTFANALLDLSAERFQVLMYYSFVVKPEL